MAAATPEQIANWPRPNYDNPENLHALVMVLTVPTFALSVISIPAYLFQQSKPPCPDVLGHFVPLMTTLLPVLGVRLYGRGVLRQTLGLDDYVMLAAMIVAIPVSVFPLVCLNLGLGLHIWDQKAEWHTAYSKIGYSANSLFPMACSLTKVSLCMTYVRLFPDRFTKIFCYTMSAFVTLYTVPTIFLSLFQCRPIRGYWDTDTKLVCINTRTMFVVTAALNSFSDCLVYLWPAKPLWSLQLPIKQRLGLIFTFSVGLLVCVDGVLRMYYLEVYFQSYDLRWNGSMVWSAMILEMDIGIICGCLSAVRPVVAVAFPTLFESSHRSESNATRPTYGHTGQSTRTESFALRPPTNTSGKNCDNKVEHAFFVGESSKPESREQGNHAWTSSNGDSGVASGVPANAIRIHQVLTVEQEE